MRRAARSVSFFGALRMPATLARCMRSIRLAVSRRCSCSRAHTVRSPHIQAQVIQLPLAIVDEHLRKPKQYCFTSPNTR